MLAEDATEDFRTERQPELAEFFQKNAWQNESAGFGRTFVLKGRKKKDPPVLGYYSLTMSRLPTEHFPPALRASFPGPHSVPTAYLTNVARDDRVQKERRLGVLLVADALRRVLRVAEDIACVGVMLYAMNKGLEGYYEREFGFFALELKPNKKNPSQLMFLPLTDVRENKPR